MLEMVGMMGTWFKLPMLVYAWLVSGGLSLISTHQTCTCGAIRQE